VALGMTDDSYRLESSGQMTYRQFTNTFLPYHPTDSVELKLKHYLHIPQDSELLEKIEWLGLLEHEPIGLENATPAQILQKRLEEKWRMEEGDRDMIVMYHKFGYRLNDELKMMESSMVALGDDDLHTAMSKTVGLPVGIATRLITEGVIQAPGVQLPISREVYQPMLEELQQFGIRFKEEEVPYKGY
jgi:saccharopine dehydrogenase-like NADP-dependent oxidoreductase